MKSCVVAVAALALLAEAAAPRTSTAQTSAIQIGAGVSASVSKLTGDDLGEQGSLKSFAVNGSLVVHSVQSVVGLSTGISFARKGTQSEFDGVTSTLHLDYAEVPVLVRLAPKGERKVRPALMLGPVIGVKVGCTIDTGLNSLSGEPKCDDPGFEGGLEFKTLDIGAAVGAEVEFAITRKLLFVPNFRFTRGLGNIGKDADIIDVKNSNVQVGAMLRIRM